MKKLKDSPDIPLYVDLDGTFIKSDMLFESLVSALKINPLIIFLCPFWLFKGKHHLKHQLSQRAEIDYSLLPLNVEFYSFLLKEKENQREIILATASSEDHAKSICQKYDLFTSYISSDENINLKGHNKLKKILSLSSVFSYAGNSSEDFDVFEHAVGKFLVNPTRKAKRMSLQTSFDMAFDNKKATFKVWAKQFRIHQWLKNCLIFIPLLVSGQFKDFNLVLLTLQGFMSFSFLASATYIINDLLDLDSDR